jgi:CRP-like cAMP-binding protein
MIHISAWARRLAGFAALTPEELQLLEQLASGSRHFTTHDTPAKSGEPADRVLVVLEGLACEYKLLPDGRRQILAYLFPGDMTDPRELLLPRMQHSLCILWPARIATLMSDAAQRLERHPNIVRALGRYSLMKQAISREWLVNVGNRTAFERTSHLLCETYERLKAVGLTTGYAFDLPLTQAELADTLALSSVHVNRTLMELRRLKLVSFQNRHAAILDYPGLCAAAGFDATYLQLPQESDSL